LEIDKLRNVDHSTQNIFQLEENIEELKQKIEDQEDNLTGRFPLIGAKHLIWDSIINLTVDFRHYLDMLEEKALLSCKSLHKCVVVNETMTRRTPEVAQNAIILCNTTTNEKLQALGVKDRIAIMMWSRKVVCKHTYTNNVKGKVEEMRNSVHQVKNIFQPLFQIDLPSFWDALGKMVPAGDYHTTLLYAIMDSSKFRELHGDLSVPLFSAKCQTIFKFCISSRISENSCLLCPILGVLS